MTALHLIKLCVGADSIEDLAEWQKERLAEAKKKKKPLELFHFTRQTPKRESELLDGGSLYWVIKGQIAVRQKLLGFKQMVRKEKPGCAILLDPKLVMVERRFHRPFQGWRYLEPGDAPKDLKGGKSAAALPEQLYVELTELGLL